MFVVWISDYWQGTGLLHVFLWEIHKRRGGFVLSQSVFYGLKFKMVWFCVMQTLTRLLLSPHPPNSYFLGPYHKVGRRGSHFILLLVLYI